MLVVAEGKEWEATKTRSVPSYRKSSTVAPPSIWEWASRRLKTSTWDTTASFSSTTCHHVLAPPQVCVTEDPDHQYPSVLPSMAREATPPWIVQSWVAIPPCVRSARGVGRKEPFTTTSASWRGYECVAWVTRTAWACTLSKYTLNSWMLVVAEGKEWEATKTRSVPSYRKSSTVAPPSIWEWASRRLKTSTWDTTASFSSTTCHHVLAPPQVCVTEDPDHQYPSVLPSMAREATPPWIVQSWVAIPPCVRSARGVGRKEPSQNSDEYSRYCISRSQHATSGKKPRSFHSARPVRAISAAFNWHL